MIYPLSLDDEYAIARAVLPLFDRMTNVNDMQKISEFVGQLSSMRDPLGSGGALVDLDEYISEVIEIVKGASDTGWRDQFRKTLYETVNLELPDADAACN